MATQKVQTHSLPHQTTSFISRESELTLITEYFAESDRKLITLVGSGGVGKTRLAIQFASQSSLPTYFIPLQALTQPEHIVTAIVNVLPFQLYNSTNPKAQLLAYLIDKQMLLVLDNFEHLLNGVSLVEAILEGAPNIKILVTSREPLNIQGEWQIQVNGLSYPMDNHPNKDLSSVKLFVERAQAVKPDFDIEAEKNAIYDICMLVKGMPLAIEIAARWVKFQTCISIKDDLLNIENRLRDVSERHRSMRAVFNHSWRLLFEDERNVFQRLAVLRGGLTIETALVVATASEKILATLVDKSMLQRVAEDRFTIHELLRQYAEEHLQSNPNEYEQTRMSHAQYFIKYLAVRFNDIKANRQASAIKEVGLEIENIRVAWQWVIENDLTLPTYEATYTMAMFFQFHSWYLDGVSLFETLVRELDQPSARSEQRLTLAVTLGLLGWLYVRVGRLDEAWNAFEKNQQVLDSLDSAVPPGPATDPKIGLSMVASIMGKHKEALSLGQQAHKLSIQQNNLGNEMMTCYVLVGPLRDQGHYEKARECAEDAYRIANDLNSHWYMALILNDLGTVARLQGDYQHAQKYHQASYDISANHFNDLGGMAGSLYHLAHIEELQKQHVQARLLYQKSFDIYQEIGDKAGLVQALTGLGKIDLIQQKDHLARHHFLLALKHTRQIQLIPMTLTVLLVLAELLFKQQNYILGIHILSFIHQHSATRYETRHLVEQRKEAFRSRMQRSTFVSAWDKGRTIDSELLFAHLMLELGSEDAQSPQARANAALSDPLTARELEVLNLLANGLRDREIAAELHISPGTVRNPHMISIRQKLNAKNRTEVVLKATECGLILKTTH